MTSAATAAALCMILGGAAAVPAAAAGKVKVFIMMGQSNMLGEGRIGSASQNTNGTLYYAVNTEHKYPYLWDTASKNWTTSKYVRNVFVMGSGGPSKPPSVGAVQTNSFMNGGEGHRGSIGPELGIGGAEGLSQLGEPVMMLKSAIGNRALGWDLLPPGSKQRDFTDPKTKKVYTYAGKVSAGCLLLSVMNSRPQSLIHLLQATASLLKNGRKVLHPSRSPGRLASSTTVICHAPTLCSRISRPTTQGYVVYTDISPCSVCGCEAATEVRNVRNGWAGEWL
jgi:hypothetical protein